MSAKENFHNKNTRRVQRSADSATLLREKYTRRRNAIQRFTDRLEKNGIADEAELDTLRAVGVSEEEIRALVEKYRG